jgi:CheY-like chemotaxis protein
MSRTPHLLHVAAAEDSRTRFAQAVTVSGLGCVLHAVASSAEAFLFLSRLGSYREAPRPRLVVVDMGRPGCEGWGLLGLLRDDPRLHTIPVVVMTDSELHIDVLRCGGMRVEDYVTTPGGAPALAELVGSFDRWLVGSSTGLALSSG